MNRILIYSNNLEKNIDAIKHIIEELSILKKEIFISGTLFEKIQQLKIKYNHIYSYENLKDLQPNIHLMLIVGGDGTFLQGIHFIKGADIPVLGINTGRLGFLTNVSIAEIKNTFLNIFNGNYLIVERSMLKLDSDVAFDDFNCGLNEFTVHKQDTSSMISIKLHINNVLVNTYWADGLIVSTPTGSTAYSLSAGGPIVHPESNSFIITPIAAHNLNVRPIVIPDHYIISLSISGRSEHCMISLDHKFKAVPTNSSFIITKSSLKIKMLQCNSYNFFNTLKNKLLWGEDKRN